LSVGHQKHPVHLGKIIVSIVPVPGILLRPSLMPRFDISMRDQRVFCRDKATDKASETPRKKVNAAPLSETLASVLKSGSKALVTESDVISDRAYTSSVFRNSR